MASAHWVWIALFLLWSHTGVFGRAVVDTQGFGTADKPTLRTDGAAEAHGQRCAELAAPWLENAQQAPEDDGDGGDVMQLQLRVRPFSPGAHRGPVFPGKSLFSFVRRVYHCCQEGGTCSSVKGIQGRLRGGTDVEFLLTREISSLTVRRAELHVQLSNPQHLDIHPVLSSMTKRGLPTRYSLWSRGDTVELKVDLLFLFQSLQEAAGARGPSLVNMRQVAFSSRGSPRNPPGTLQDTDGDVWGNGAALDLGLVLGCSQAGSAVSCENGGVHLSHTPFMALYYR